MLFPSAETAHDASHWNQPLAEEQLKAHELVVSVLLHVKAFLVFYSQRFLFVKFIFIF